MSLFGYCSALQQYQYNALTILLITSSPTRQRNSLYFNIPLGRKKWMWEEYCPIKQNKINIMTRIYPCLNTWYSSHKMFLIVIVWYHYMVCFIMTLNIACMKVYCYCWKCFSFLSMKVLTYHLPIHFTFF